MIYDLIIVGNGCAGMSAAIYAKRNNLNVLVIASGPVGGLINETNVVDNYLGFEGISGPDLAYKMYKHFKSYNIEQIKEKVIEIVNNNGINIIKTNNNEYKSLSLIIATGRRHKKLPVANANLYEEKGISYCAICDGNLYKNKNVVIVGAGNSALEEGIYLTNICNKVTLLVRSDKIKGDASLAEDFINRDNTEVMYNTEIISINGQDKVESVTLKSGDILKTDGIFVYIGFEPTTDILKNLPITNELGYINVDSNQETPIKGVFACGDVVNKKVYQIVTAVSEGAVAAINAGKYKN